VKLVYATFHAQNNAYLAECDVFYFNFTTYIKPLKWILWTFVIAKEDQIMDLDEDKEVIPKR